jgi:hypothetical protein
LEVILGFDRIAVGIFNYNDLEELSSIGYEVLGGLNSIESGKFGKNNEKEKAAGTSNGIYVVLETVADNPLH